MREKLGMTLRAATLLGDNTISILTDVEIVAAPLFPGESMPVYRSVMVGRPGVMAVNEFGSWSGWRAYLEHDIRLKGLDVFAETIDWPAPPFSVSTSLDSAVSELLVNALLGCLSLIPTDFATYEPMLGSSGS